MKIIHITADILIIVIFLSANCQAESLGRLFFSPTEREQFSQKEPVQHPPPKIPQRVDGIIQGRDGRRMVWVNGKIHRAQMAKNNLQNSELSFANHAGIVFKIEPFEKIEANLKSPDGRIP